MLRICLEPDLPPDRLAELLEPVAAAVRAGGVVAFPTDTYYGLGADPMDAAAVARVHAVKGRDPRRPLLLVLDDLSRAAPYVRQLPGAVTAIAESLWPGPVTIVVPAAPDLPPGVTGGRDTVAIRVEGHPLARRLVALCGRALTGTSANRSGNPPLTCPDDVAVELGEHLDALLDAGRTPGGEPSTLVDLTAEPPAILRAGAVSRERLAAVLGLAPDRLGDRSGERP